MYFHTFVNFHKPGKSFWKRKQVTASVMRKQNTNRGVALTNEAACRAETSTDKAQLLVFAVKD